jgi:predicted transcriptional regulator of viral defense system
MDRRQATKLLARWNTQGWIKRLQRGLYAPVPIASLGQSQVLDDPWLIVPTLFGPAYIGGWTAAEHWGLTEQIFRGVCVLTARSVRGKEKTIQGVDFSLKRISKRAMFGTKPLWRGRVKVEISNPAKTIIDMLDDPAIGGGIRHVSDCLGKYFSENKGTAEELISIGERLANGAVFKRLGFLGGAHGAAPAQLMRRPAFRERLTAGNREARRGGARDSRKLVARWRVAQSRQAGGRAGRHDRSPRKSWTARSRVSALSRARRGEGLRSRLGAGGHLSRMQELAGSVAVQGRHLSQEMLLRDLPLFRGPGFYSHRRGAPGCGISGDAIRGVK